ncbi:hypothetical protein GCM10009563_16560 [Subtercola frigoramans]
MKTQPEEDDETTYVIVSLTIHSAHPIAALSVFSEDGPTSSPSDEHHYEVHRASFSEADWSVRAERLDKAVNEALDKLDQTGLDTAELHHPAVFVRAFFTFGRGAETLSAEMVGRLARVHATIWIDANG